MECNALDVEGSLPGFFSLIKQKHSHLVNICDPIDGSSILQTIVSFVSCPYPKYVGYCFLALILGYMIHVYNIYSDSEICVVVLFRTYLDSCLPGGSSTLFFRS